jgi:hypothetical protein
MDEKKISYTESAKESIRKYREKNREKINEKNREYYHKKIKDPEYKKKLREQANARYKKNIKKTI